ncbi:MAG: acetoacetate--CoA ligase [FCB group bacterium]|nr:acetoacetate--CoA ligase [FCB group bacterium]
MSKLLWKPNQENIQSAQMTQFRQYVNKTEGLKLEDYPALYDWSVNRIADFWQRFWDWSSVVHSGEVTAVVDDPDKMPGAKWFSGVTLNYAENLLQNRSGRTALEFYGEDRQKKSLTFRELFDEVEKLADALRNAGVMKGDRIAGFMPNLPETVIAMLASASIGAIWSSSSPDFGIKGVLDRFSQIQPKIIFAADGYFYNGKQFDSLEKLRGILSSLPSVKKVVVVSYTRKPALSDLQIAVEWGEFLSQNPAPLRFERLPFSHPLYVMYSSGTTGLPKSIVHSAGGTLLQHLKELRLHCDLRENEKIFYFTTCGWMMWNWLVSGLAVGATVVLYDGNPFYPAPDSLIRLAADSGFSYFGTSAKYIASLEAAGVSPAKISDFPKLKAILSTGSPLSEESFEYVYREWKTDVQLSSISGGTDIISCFVLGNPVLPVYSGEIQCRGLGMKVSSFDRQGRAVWGERGELVCERPFPSMPVYFWNDEDGSKYRKAYFETYPKVWHHGDFMIITETGGIVMLGRSDATLNPGGVRIGTAEIYRVVEALPEIADSVVVGQKWQNDERVILFVKMADGRELTGDVKASLIKAIRSGCSPRHVPRKIIAIDDVPYTINGKKVEIAVNRIIHGEDVANKDALRNPDCLELYRNLPELQED